MGARTIQQREDDDAQRGQQVAHLHRLRHGADGGQECSAGVGDGGQSGDEEKELADIVLEAIPARCQRDALVSAQPGREIHNG